MPAPEFKKLRRIQNQDSKKPPVRVLYVEDAEVIRDTIARLLEIYGYDVNYARNGQEGVEMAIHWHPDVILMDLRMPIMDGYRAIQELKLNPKTRDIPVFVVSAWSSQKERDQARLAGADQFFVKPPELTKLVAAIEHAVAAAKQ
ncbi:MAG: response regulator [Anaerolineae bacterium]